MISELDLGFTVIVIVYKIICYGLIAALLYGIYEQLRSKL